MVPTLTLLLGATALLASSLNAQKTWIVDQSNGAGTHFRDLASYRWMGSQLRSASAARLQADRVTIDRSSFASMLEVVARNTTISQCLITGRNARHIYVQQTVHVWEKSSVGLKLSSSTSLLSQCAIRDGFGLNSLRYKLPPSPAARLTGNTVLAGDASSSVSSATTAIMGIGALLYDPSISISKPRFSGFTKIYGGQRIPCLTGTAAVRGQSFRPRARRRGTSLPHPATPDCGEKRDALDCLKVRSHRHSAELG